MRAIHLLWIGAVLSCGAAAESERNAVRRVVQRGDTLDAMVEAQYGSVRMKGLVKVVNRLVDDELLEEGRELVFPTASSFFLAPYGIENRGPTCWLRPRGHAGSGQVFLPFLITTAPGEGNHRDRRFLLLEISGVPYCLVFDSFVMARLHPDMEVLDRVDRWEIIDLDGDGDLDVRCRTAGAAKPVTDIVFHWSRKDRTYRPYVVCKEVVVAAERTEHDGEGRLIFVYQPQGMEQTVRVHWQHLHKGNLASLKAVPGDLLPPPVVPAADEADCRAVCGGLVVMDKERIRLLGAAAVRERYPRLDVSRLDRGMIVCLENPVDPSQTHVFVSWLGLKALEVQRGATRDEDRAKVRKIQVKMTADGQILDVKITTAWVVRSTVGAID